MSRPYEVRETDWADSAGQALRKALGVEMEERYADRLSEVMADADRIGAALAVEAEDVAYVGVAYDEHVPVGHVALRRRRDELEIKRMYVTRSHRGAGVSVALLRAVEDAARARGVTRIVLQTGDRQPDAVRLDEREGYAHIPVFPPYDLLFFSICMGKSL
ncbi:GNAT family N-acetyltransferase [Actinomadura barringtoniae]|uniref:GNAT family N-acetyltransferase n=1 Tax=Actinomadura barringtoniae TaxID=1427535 RepID=A0A939T3D1_9ACTN|nr:GNAT family N-acetyltransferase [Actinomadura barringtoniae]MBO2447938.1 GNAT family N-acetyltransferase [Actinomadura barringtoniae]